MDKSPKLTWGSPAFKDNNSLGLNQRGSNTIDNPSVGVETPTQGSNNNEDTRLPWGSPLSPSDTYFAGSPISSSSPKSPYFGHEKQMQKCYIGRNYSHDSWGPGEAQHPRRFSSSSPISFGTGRGRPLFHGSPVSKQNQCGNYSSSSRYNAAKNPSRSFHGDNTPYCSPNSPNISSNQSFTAEDYFKPSMLEDPWEKLKEKDNLRFLLEDQSRHTLKIKPGY